MAIVRHPPAAFVYLGRLRGWCILCVPIMSLGLLLHVWVTTWQPVLDPATHLSIWCLDKSQGYAHIAISFCHRTPCSYCPAVQSETHLPSPWWEHTKAQSWGLGYRMVWVAVCFANLSHFHTCRSMRLENYWKERFKINKKSCNSSFKSIALKAVVKNIGCIQNS